MKHIGILFKVIVVLVGVIVFVMGCKYSSNTTRASRYIARNKPNKAIEILTKDILNKNDDYLTYFYLAVAYNEKGEFQKALSAYNKSIDLNSEFFYSLINRGVLCAKLCNYSLALESYNKALNLNPNSYEVHLYRGRLFHKKNKLKEAFADYDISLALKANSMKSLVYKARLLFDMKKYTESSALFERALTLYPNEAKVLDEYAWTLVIADKEELRNLEKAFILARKAVKEYPCSVSYDTLALVYASFKDFPKAITFQKKAISLHNKEENLDPMQKSYLFELKERLKAYENKKKWIPFRGKYRSYTINP